MKPCANCGRYIPEDAAVCPHCQQATGAPAAAPAATTAPTQPVVVVPAEAAPPAAPSPATQSVYCRTCDQLVVVPIGTQVCPTCRLPFASEYQADLPRNLGRLVEKSGWVTLIAGGITVVASVVLFFALRPMANPGSWLERLLYPSSGGWLIPWATVVVFLWGLILLIFRLQLVKAERRAPSLPFAEQIVSDVRSQNIDRAVEQLQRIGNQRPIGLYLHRVSRALSEWDRTRDGASVHRALSDQATLDMDTLQSSINIVRVFIWAAPILGFIGTVLGISMGVDQFSNTLLGGAAEQLQMGTVQNALVKVASCLAFAFNTTLLGLLAALILMIAYAWIQRLEDDLLDNVYDEVNKRVVTLLVGEEGVGKIGKVEVTGGLSEEEIAVAKEVAEAIRDATGGLAVRADALEREGRLLESAAVSLRVLADQNQTAWEGLRSALEALQAQSTRQMELMGRLNEASAGWPQELQKAADTIGASLQAQREELTGELVALNRRLDERTAQQAEALGQVGEAVAQWPQQLEATRTTMAETFRADRAQLVSELRDENGRILGEVSGRLSEGQQQIADAVRALGGELGGSVSATVAASTRQLQEQMQHDQAQLAERVTAGIAQGNQEVTGQITAAVGELRQTVSRVDESLRHLSSPFELHLVPKSEGADR